MDSVIILLLAIPGIIAGLALATIANGWALHLLWAWFVVPVFDLPAITIGQALGLSMIVSFLTYQYIESPKDTEKDKWKSLGAIGRMIIRPFVTVLLGLIIKQFV